MSNRSKRVVIAEGEPEFFQSVLDKWSKGLQMGAKWDKESFEEFPACVHWFRQIVSVTVAVALGFIGLTGAPGLVGGYGFVTGLTYLYYTGYIEADEFSYGEKGLKMEGVVQSLAAFVLAWITCYTAMGHGLPEPTV